MGKWDIWDRMCTFTTKFQFSMKCNSEYLKEDGRLDYSVYAEYFADNIQPYNENGEEVLSAMSYDRFLEDWNNNLGKNLNEMSGFLVGNPNDDNKEKMCTKLEACDKELSKKGIDIDYPNLYFLCRYIISLDKGWYLALLKPTTKQTLDMIDDIEKVSFTNKDGNIVETSLNSIISPIKETLANIEADSSTYEVEKIVRVQEYSNPELFQANFVYLLSRFLREFFPNAIRKTNSYISNPEKELVLVMLSYFGLAPKEGLTLERYRQLRMFAKDIVEEFGFFEMDGIGLVPISFVKYEDWKDLKLSYIVKSPKEVVKDGIKTKRTKEERITADYKKVLTQLEIGDTIVFTKKSIEEFLLNR